MNLNELSAEIDLAVAKAVKLPGARITGGHCWRDGKMDAFCPSRRIGDAMEAAEKAFPAGWTLSATVDDGVMQYAFHSHATPGTVTRDVTAPLAICGAILKLSGTGR